MATKGGPFSDLIVFVTPALKGGVGKTETTDNIEPLLTLSERPPLLVDVDDGNSGLIRRVGHERVHKLKWSTSPRSARRWIDEHLIGRRSVIFDIGAGLDSCDLPILATLETIWRILADGGAKIIFCAIVSTNAHTANFVARLQNDYSDLGTVAIVYNDQDGSKQWPKNIDLTGKELINLSQAQSGIQAVRLSRQDCLSTVLRSPAQGYSRATALMAFRVYLFGLSQGLSGLFTEAAFDELETLFAARPRNQAFTIGNSAEASDAFIDQNERCGVARDALLRPDLQDTEIFEAGRTFRREFLRWNEMKRHPN